MNGATNLHPKVVGGGAGTGLGALIVWLLGLAHVAVDPVVAVAIAGVLSTIGAWLAPVVDAERQKLLGPTKSSAAAK